MREIFMIWLCGCNKSGRLQIWVIITGVKTWAIGIGESRMVIETVVHFYIKTNI